MFTHSFTHSSQGINTTGAFGKLHEGEVADAPFTGRFRGRKVTIVDTGKTFNKLLRTAMRGPGYALVALGAQETAERLYPKLSAKKYEKINHEPAYLREARQRIKTNRAFDEKQKQNTAAQKSAPSRPFRNPSNSNFSAPTPSTQGSTDSESSSPRFNSLNNDGTRSRSSSVDSVASNTSDSLFFEAIAAEPLEHDSPDKIAAQVAADINTALQKAQKKE
jgi:hypothetical protein